MGLPNTTAALSNDHLTRPNDMALQENDDLPSQPVALLGIPHEHLNLHKTSGGVPANKTTMRRGGEAKGTANREHDNCERLRPEEEDRSRLDNLVNMSPALLGKTVTPFLKEHIPGLYAPIGKPENREVGRRKDPNSKYCYRHRPDSKCRKAADEKKMAMIQSELDKLPFSDQQAITHVWSLFSAAPSKHRDLMLQGIMTQCCFFQLSTVAREVEECLKIDFLVALPVEISQKILCFLDTESLLKAAQVSQRWRMLADSDAVWVHMCEQHIDRKCTRCGWGLPKLERKRLRDYTRQRQLAKQNNVRVEELVAAHVATPSPAPSLSKRDARCLEDGDEGNAKRQRVHGAISSNSTTTTMIARNDEEPKLKPWKQVYRDRWKVGYNWRNGRACMKILGTHTNGVTCLQIQDNFLATGSYDATIKIWDLSGKDPVEVRTLRGHTRGIRALQFDENKLISGALDNAICVWDWVKGTCVSTLRGHTEGVIGLHFQNDFLASGSADKSIKIFNFKSKETFCLKAHQDWVNSVRLDAASKTVFSASDDCTAKLWDLDSRTEIRTFSAHVGHVQQVLILPPDYEPDDEIMGVNGTMDNTDSVSVASGRSSTPTAVCRHDSSLSQDDDLRLMYGHGFVSDPSRPLPPRYIMTGGLDSTIRLWDTATGRCLKTFFGHVEGIWSLAGDSLRVVSSANDGMVKIWDPRSGKCERTITGHRGPVTCVGLSESRMASGSEDCEVRLYSFQGVSNVAEVGTPN